MPSKGKSGKSAQSNAQERAAIFMGILTVAFVAFVVLTRFFGLFQIRTLIEIASQLQFNNWRNANFWFYCIYGLAALIIAAICLFVAASKVKGKNDAVYKKNVAPSQTALLCILQLIALVVALLYPIIFHIIGGSADASWDLIWLFHLPRLGLFGLLLTIAAVIRIGNLDTGL